MAKILIVIVLTVSCLLTGCDAVSPPEVVENGYSPQSSESHADCKNNEPTETNNTEMPSSNTPNENDVEDTADTEPEAQPTPENGANSPVCWEEFINNGIKKAEFSGGQEWMTVDYSHFDAATEFDIDDDGETELITRYIYLAYDYADTEILDFAYIILKNHDGNIEIIADFWNRSGLETNILRFNGNTIVVVTNLYAMVATRYKVSSFEICEFVEDFSFTKYGDAESDDMVIITHEDGVTYASLGSWHKEKYFGNNLSTSDLSINSHEELVNRINEVNSYPEIEF